MKTTQLFAIETQVWCEVKTWLGTKWYCWSFKRHCWVADVDCLSYISMMEGVKYLRSYIKDIILENARKIGKLEFTLCTGKKLKLP